MAESKKVVHAYLIKVSYWTEHHGLISEWLVLDTDAQALCMDSIQNMIASAEGSVGAPCELEQLSYLGMKYAEEGEHEEED